MEPRREPPVNAQKRVSILLVSIMIFSLIPTFVTPVIADDSGRDANITLSINPSAQTVNPGETAEYTVRVYNNGANPVSVNLAASNSQDCNGYTSTIGQIAQPIDSNDYGETTLNVTLAQTAEDDCVTTVTANANEQVTPPDQPGAPAQESKEVTTTAGDGAGSTLYGVDLTIEQPSKTWGGTTTVEWDVEVENTGQLEETVDLSVDSESGGGCSSSSSSLDVEVDPSQITISGNDSEWVTIILEVPDGQAADKYCWELTGVVTNDQNPNGSATDSESFQITVPELHECELELDKTTLSVEPGETGTLTATFSNTGNSDWSINVGFNGPKSGWADVDGASSGTLPYSNGDGEIEFTIEVSPDDSIEANSQSVITIQGKDGGASKCSADISVTVGQSHGASMSLTNTALYNVEPGGSATTSLTVSNQGNGPETFRISSSAPPTGWSVNLEESTISTDSRLTNDDSGTIEVEVSLPLDALATDEVEITFSVLPNTGGAAYATQVLRITVKSVYAMSGEAPAEDQTGRSDTEVKFPLTVTNDGNSEADFRFSVISQTASPAWGTYFEDSEGTVISSSSIEINARETVVIYLAVSIDGEEELSSSRLTVRVTNLDDNNNSAGEDGVPANQLEFVFRAILSDRNFAMDALIMNSESDFSRNELVPLAPGGSVTYTIKVINTGDSTDEALFEFSGLEGLATRTIYDSNGNIIENSMMVQKGWGAMNNTTGQFFFDGSAPLIGSTEEKIVEKMISNELMETHVPVIYYAIITLKIEVSDGAENGESGILDFVVISSSNAANRSGKVSFSVVVETVLSISMELSDSEDKSQSMTFGKIGDNPVFEIELTNTGNVETEVRVFSSGNIRDWTIQLSAACDKDDNNDLLCTIPVGETITINVKVTGPDSETGTIADTFDFTISAEPTGLPEVVGRVNLELTVEGEPEEFGLNSLITPNVLYGLGGTILVAMLLMIFRRRV